MNVTRLLTATTFLLTFGHSAVAQAQTGATTPSQFGVTAPTRRAAADLFRPGVRGTVIQAATLSTMAAGSGGLQRRSSMQPSKRRVYIGLAVGGLLGFVLGSGLERSACEWNCPPGQITWGITAAGAGAGAGVGWLLRVR
jgi:hypothetical protein